MAENKAPPSSAAFEKTSESNSNSDIEQQREDATPYTGVVDEKEYGHVRRGLKARHVQFIAIGGIIGTGLFVGSGAALVRAGPGSIFLAYSIVGTVIYSLMLAIGEV
jgi:amino acid transporter